MQGSIVAVLGGVLIALAGRSALLRADERRDASGGAGSWMSPSTRRFWAVVVIAIGLGVAAVGALA